MSVIGSAVEGVFKGVGDAVGHVANGIGEVANGAGNLVKGALTLNPKEALSGVGQIAGGAFKAGKASADLTPEGFEASAAHNLLDAGLKSLGGGDNGTGSKTS
jgi:hypothetical protein